MKASFERALKWLLAASIVLLGSAHAQAPSGTTLRLSPEWVAFPGKMNDIGVGADGSVWAIGSDAVPGGHSIFRFNGTGWDKAPGGAVRIDVDPQGNPWVVNSGGNIYRLVNGAWQQMPGGAKDIGIGANGAVWIIGMDYGVYAWTGSSWMRIPNAAGTRIDVDSAGRPWLVNAAGEVWAANGTTFTLQAPIGATDIAIGGDFVLAVDKYGRLHQHGSYGWAFQAEHVKAVSVDGDGLPWAVSTSGEVVTRNFSVTQSQGAAGVSALNAQYAGAAGIHFAQKQLGAWELHTSIGAFPFKELQRNGTSIQLKGAGTQEYLLDFGRRAIFNNLRGEGTPIAMTNASAATGETVGHVELTLYNSAGLIVGRTVLSESITNGTRTGWTLDSWGTRKTLAANAVTGTMQRVTFRDTVSYEVDVLTRQCKVAGYGCKVARVESVTGLTAGQFTLRMAGQLYTLTHVHNDLRMWRLDGNSPDASASQTWTEVKRTLDYVEFSAPSFGTSTRARLRVNGQWDSVQYPSGVIVPQGPHVAAAQRHWPGQLGVTIAPLTPGVAPGFQIVNKTDLPVLISLEQVGCLYYGVVQPGQVFERKTGAVWFSIKASIAPDLVEPKDWQCAIAPAMYTLAVLAVAGTGGVAAPVILPAMMITAAGIGTGYAVGAKMHADGFSSLESEATQVGISALTSGGVTMAVAISKNPKAYGEIAGRTAATVFGTLAGGSVQIGWDQLVVQGGISQAQVDSISKELTQEISVYGAYAGWHGKEMPRYEITGGPRVVSVANGDKIVIPGQPPLKLTRVN